MQNLLQSCSSFCSSRANKGNKNTRSFCWTWSTTPDEVQSLCFQFCPLWPLTSDLCHLLLFLLLVGHIRNVWPLLEGIGDPSKVTGIQPSATDRPKHLDWRRCDGFVSVDLLSECGRRHFEEPTGDDLYTTSNFSGSHITAEDSSVFFFSHCSDE